MLCIKSDEFGTTYVNINRVVSMSAGEEPDGFVVFLDTGHEYTIPVGKYKTKKDASDRMSRLNALFKKHGC